MIAEIRDLCERWNFVPTEELPQGHCSRVFADHHKVLKVPFRGEELRSGLRAAVSLQDFGGPQIYAVDEASGCILMERLHPGDSLGSSSLSDAEQCEIAAQMMLNLREIEFAEPLPLEYFLQGSHPMLAELFESTETRTFLHGDLHQENILSSSDRWRVIDPKGLYGDPNYEPVAFLRNPFDSLWTIPNLEQVQRLRIQMFAERLGLDPRRICAWSWVDLSSMESEGLRSVAPLMQLILESL